MVLRFSLFISALIAFPCCTSHSLHQGGDGDGDGDADADGDADGDGDGDGDGDADADGDGDGDGDRPLQCGDEREPFEIPPEPIVNGVGSWDSSVVPLTVGQSLAIGAILAEWEGEWTNICTATVVTPTVVLTAAHCFFDWWMDRYLEPEEVRFALGEDSAEPVAVFTPAGLVPHPAYNFWVSDSAEFDLAVLLFDEPLTEGVDGLEPITANCDPLDASDFIGSRIQAVGYGTTNPEEEDEVNTRRWWTTEEVWELTSFDFVVNGFGISGVCFGDSGGPALWTWPSLEDEIRVIGTVSWGDESCVDLDYFARTDAECTFLNEFLEQCSEETFSGRCDDEIAVYCEDGEVVEIDCGSMGLRCANTGSGVMRCVEGPERCGDETPSGRCDDGMAIYCEDDEVVMLNCPAMGMTCGDIGGGRMRCLELIDPCNGETVEGRCAGDRAIWCDNNVVNRINCAASGQVCGDAGEGQMRCIPNPCRGISWTGRCLAGSAVWCHLGEIRIRVCSECGQRCGWSDEFEAYYCID